jgi:hypothetical protein
MIVYNDEYPEKHQFPRDVINSGIVIVEKISSYDLNNLFFFWFIQK